jgi:prepilin peptidase CpaA
MDLHAFAMHLAAGGAMFAIALLCFAAGWVGGGDAKLASVVALWLGVDGAFEFIVLASVFGGVLTFVLLAFRRAVLPAFAVRQPWVMRLHDHKEGVPYGIALAVAGMITYPHTIWMQMVIG